MRCYLAVLVNVQPCPHSLRNVPFVGYYFGIVCFPHDKHPVERVDNGRILAVESVKCKSIKSHLHVLLSCVPNSVHCLQLLSVVYRPLDIR